MTDSNISLTPGDIKILAVDPVGATILNISQTGMAIQTWRPLSMNQRYRFTVSCNDSTVSLDGKVIRCNLGELAQKTSGGALPVYLNGIRFLLERNALEVSLLEILHDNILNEKRIAPRIKPHARISLTIAHPMDWQVVAMESDGILIHSAFLPDMDETYELVVQAGSESLPLMARILHVSKKEGASHYFTRFEFVELEEEMEDRIESIVQRLGRQEEPSA